MSLPEQEIILTSVIENLLRIILPCYYQICLYKVIFSVQYNESIEKIQVHIDCQLQFYERVNRLLHKTLKMFSLLLRNTVYIHKWSKNMTLEHEKKLKFQRWLRCHQGNEKCIDFKRVHLQTEYDMWMTLSSDFECQHRPHFQQCGWV